MEAQELLKLMQYSAGASMTLNKTANPSVQGLVFKTGSSTTGTTNVMFATATYGSWKSLCIRRQFRS